MRALFSIVGLLVVVAIVGLLAKKQLTSAGSTTAAPPAAATGGVAVPAGTPKQQLDQVKQSLDAAAQPRAMPDDTK